MFLLRYPIWKDFRPREVFTEGAPYSTRHYISFHVANRTSNILENFMDRWSNSLSIYFQFLANSSTHYNYCIVAYIQLWYDLVIIMSFPDWKSGGICILFLLRWLLRKFSSSLSDDSSSGTLWSNSRISMLSTFSFSPLLVPEALMYWKRTVGTYTDCSFSIHQGLPTQIRSEYMKSQFLRVNVYFTNASKRLISVEIGTSYREIQNKKTFKKTNFDIYSSSWMNKTQYKWQKII